MDCNLIQKLRKKILEKLDSTGSLGDSGEIRLRFFYPDGEDGLYCIVKDGCVLSICSMFKEDTEPSYIHFLGDDSISCLIAFLA